MATPTATDNSTLTVPHSLLFIGTVILPDRVLADGGVSVADGRIAAVDSVSKVARQHDALVIDARVFVGGIEFRAEK